MNITSSKEILGNTTLTSFFSDGVLIARMEQKPAAFCTVRNGRRSLIRDTWKTANYVHWQYGAIRAISPKFDFEIGCPDLSWGIAGEKISKKMLEERLAAGSQTTSA